MHTTKAFPRLALAVPLAVALAAAVGCAGGDPDDSAETTFETSGDTIIARIGAADTALNQTLVAELSIGDADGEDAYMFGGIYDVAVGPDGKVFVWDGRLQELRLFDSSGTYIRNVGGKGSGPGEFDRGVNGIAVRNDGKLLVWDAGNARVNVYSSQGDHETQWTAASGFFTSRALFADTTGNVYARGIVGRDSARGSFTTGLLRYDSSGAIRDSILPPEFGTEQPELRARANGGSSSTYVPYFPVTAWTISPFGYLVGGPGSPYEIHVMRGDGQQPVRIVRRFDAPAVDPGERDEQRARIMFMLRRTDPAYQWNGPDIPATKPAFRSLSVDLDGRIWVQISQPSERISEDDRTPAPATPPPGGVSPQMTWREPTAYHVYSPDGQYLGHVRMPWRTTMFRARGNHMWATTLDSMDVPNVTRFRLEPGLGNPR